MEAERMEFDSTCVSWAIYDNSTLYVMYTSGGFYSYAGVPADVWTQMKSAESTGTFVNEYIKGTYSYNRLN